MTVEHQRLTAVRTSREPWRLWGPYLSERQWGTVREDYSASGAAWDSFPHDHARSRAYRWGEDGLAGISDENQRLCFAIALWNGRDPILKERLFGLTNSEGNHGEDVKEYYFYLDNTPTHSYMKMLYKYPHAPFPYGELIEENARRKSDTHSFEYELIDTGVFAANRYFDVQVEYAKNSPTDILIRITLANRADEPATLCVLPTLWFRNTWSWGQAATKPRIEDASPAGSQTAALKASHATLGEMFLRCEGAPELLFCDNETNTRRVFGAADSPPFPKDGINDFVVAGRQAAVNPNHTGTKAAALYRVAIGGNETLSIRLRLTQDLAASALDGDFDAIFNARIGEADEFYCAITPATTSEDRRAIQRQAYAGMLWSKQYFYYIVERWLQGDPASPPPPSVRWEGRNNKWLHFAAEDVMSMPDAWEYPWFASWDLCFHTTVFAHIDPDFAKDQLYLLTREWFMSPDGQVPAYEWAFDDVNPPVLAWAAWQIYQTEQASGGQGDREFLKKIFQHCLLYFTWWVNRKDADGNNLFQGGFLGLDNIGAFDRSEQRLPGGTRLYQCDGTSWMAMFALDMLRIALELSNDERYFVDIAGKFLQHFLVIADAINDVGRRSGLDVEFWDEQDGFYYSVLRLRDGPPARTKAHSLEGLMVLYAAESISLDRLEQSLGPTFRERLESLIAHDPGLARGASRRGDGALLLSIVDENRLRRILMRLLDENEFFSPHGIRSVSKYHAGQPLVMEIAGGRYTLDYEPAESNTIMFGGNSNWRGPIWFPVNYLLVESLARWHAYYGDAFTVECPTGSGVKMTLQQVGDEIRRRLISIFERGSDGRRPVYGGTDLFQHDSHWRDHILFYEYFHGDNGAGLGASHQTGWTGLVANVIQQQPSPTKGAH